MFVLSAIHRPVLTLSGTVHGSSHSQYTLSSVLRPAGLLSLNLPGRGSGFVPANGCLATLLLRWQCVRSTTVQNQSHSIVGGTLSRQAWGNLRFPLTVTYHGCRASLGFASSVPQGRLTIRLFQLGFRTGESVRRARLQPCHKPLVH